MSNMSGHILLCSGPCAYLYTLNGHLLVEQNLSGSGRPHGPGVGSQDETDPITCCAFHETPSTAWISSELILTGHRRGVVKVRLFHGIDYFAEQRCSTCLLIAY